MGARESIDLPGLMAMCLDARRMLEPGLARNDQGSPISAGACLHASVMLAYILVRFTTCTVIVRGGAGMDGNPPDAAGVGQGLCDPAGVWHGHYWLEVRDLQGNPEPAIADITGDQFGYPGVVVGLLESLAYRYRSGEQAPVDQAARGVSQEVCAGELEFVDGRAVLVTPDRSPTSSPSSITVSGADEATDLDELEELVDAFPFLEVGLLYTTTPEGRPRYPARPWIKQTLRRLEGRCALHVCGRGARAELLTGEMQDLVRLAPRVQVNGQVDAGALVSLGQRVGTLITQHNPGNAGLVSVQVPNHCLLVDESLGSGSSPHAWAAPATEKLVGFAGGLGPENLGDELLKISLVARQGSWVDMEGKLRVNDQFSASKARLCAQIFARWLAVGAGTASSVVARQVT